MHTYLRMWNFKRETEIIKTNTRHISDLMTKNFKLNLSKEALEITFGYNSWKLPKYQGVVPKSTN